MAYAKVATENYEFEFVPKAPYDCYLKGIVSSRIRDGRRGVSLIGETDVPNIGVPRLTSYARYLYQVDLWEREGKLIPKDLEVDHIDDDCTNDSLENFQLLTYSDNVRKRDLKNYNGKAPSTELLGQINDDILSRLQWTDICRKRLLTGGYLRYLIANYFPELKEPEILELNTEDIISKMEKGYSQSDLMFDYGVNQCSISRFIAKHLPFFSKERQTASKVAFIRRGLLSGRTNISMAEELGCTDANIIYFVKTYLPELKGRLIEKADGEKAELVERIGSLIKGGMKQEKIAKKVGITPNMVKTIVGQFFPDYTKKNLYRRRVESIISEVEDGHSVPEISKALELPYGVVYTAILKNRPDLSQKLTEQRLQQEATHKQAFEDLLKEGKSLREICVALDIVFASALEYARKHFPTYPQVPAPRAAA